MKTRNHAPRPSLREAIYATKRRCRPRRITEDCLFEDTMPPDGKRHEAAVHGRAASSATPHRSHQRTSKSRT